MANRFQHLGICRWNDCTCAQSSPSLSRLDAEQMLRRRAQEGMGIGDFRRFVDACGYGPSGSLSDHEVIQLLAGQVSSGILRICNTLPAVQDNRDRAGAAAAARPKAASFPLSERAARSESRPQQAADPATFSSNIDADAQAAVLQSAAASGAPFCPE
jgi:hypothetical protein